MLSGIWTFAGLSWRRKSLAVEALFHLSRAKLILSLWRFEHVAHSFGKNVTIEYSAPEPADIHSAAELGKMVQVIATRLPFECTCLPQAIATKRMLDRRNISSTFHFGILPREASKSERLIDAHAWVAIANRIIVGGRESKGYKIIATFA